MKITDQHKLAYYGAVIGNRIDVVDVLSDDGEDEAFHILGSAKVDKNKLYKIMIIECEDRNG